MTYYNKECEHESKTFNEDIGAFICDECNERILFKDWFLKEQIKQGKANY